MNQITSMFGYQDESGEDAHIALEAVLEKLHLPYPEDASLLDKIELVSHSALVLFRTCDKMKRKNDSLVMSKESLQEYSKNMLIKISQKEELLQFYKVNTDFDEPVDDDDEKRSKFEILRSLSLSSMLKLYDEQPTESPGNSQLDEANKNLIKLREECIQLTEESCNFEAEYLRLKEEVSISKMENETLTGRISVLSDQLLLLNERHEEINKQKSDSENKYENAITSLTLNNDELSKKLSSMTGELKMLQHRYEELQELQNSQYLIEPGLKLKLIQVFGDQETIAAGTTTLEEETVNFLWKKVFETVKDLQTDFETSLRKEKASTKKFQLLYYEQQRLRQSNFK